MEDQLRPLDERDMVSRMRLFARFHTPKEHETFIQDLLKAKRLRKDIAKLQMCRRMGSRPSRRRSGSSWIVVGGRRIGLRVN